MKNPLTGNANDCDGVKPSSCWPGFVLNLEGKCVDCSGINSAVQCANGNITECQSGYVPDLLSKSCLKCVNNVTSLVMNCADGKRVICSNKSTNPGALGYSFKFADKV